MSDRVEAGAELTNQKVQFTATARDNPPIVFDYYPPFGDGKGYTGLEGLLASLCACSGTSVLGLLRKNGTDVVGLKVQAIGQRRTKHPTCFETIALHFDVVSANASDEGVREAIRLSEELVCPVWAMIKGNVEIGVTHAITAPDA